MLFGAATSATNHPKNSNIYESKTGFVDKKMFGINF
jgi:hypothetical protein